MITDHVLSSSLIPTLLRAQTSPSSTLPTKMTLRDCTLFVQIPRELFDPQAPVPHALQPQPPPTGIDRTPQNPTAWKTDVTRRQIRIVIADLDKKDQEVRGEYWRSIEAQLVEGGYYMGHGKISEEEDCDLRDVVWTSDQVVWNHCSI